LSGLKYDAAKFLCSKYEPLKANSVPRGKYRRYPFICGEMARPATFQQACDRPSPKIVLDVFGGSVHENNDEPKFRQVELR